MARARFALLVPLALLVPAACSDDDDPPARSGSPSASGSEAEAGSTTTTADGTTSTTGGTPAPTSTTTPAGDGIPLEGDGGAGNFAYELVVERSELCYRLLVDPAPTAARIVRVDGGGLVLELGGTGNQCVASDAITLEEIGTAPGDFAVEVTTADGTLRATLR